MLPASNATITAITGPGASTDWDATGEAGETTWEGRARCYLTRTESRERTAEGVVDQVETRTLYLAPAMPTPAPGDTVTIERDGFYPYPETFTVESVKGDRVNGISAPVRCGLRAS